MSIRSSSRRIRALILAVTAHAATGCALRQARKGEAERLPPDAAWFARQRMSSGEPIPVDALRRAMVFRSQGEADGPKHRLAPGTWSAIGPTNIGGRLTALAVDPNDADHVWAGAAAGGVFESRDAGTTWTAVFDDQPVLNVGALATHPTNSSIVYVGTGEANGSSYSYDGDGVYRTLDGGVSWQHLGLAETRRIGRIAIDPVNPQRVFVAAAGGVFMPDAFRGVYRSTDGGTTWTNVLFVAPTAGAIDVAIDPANPARIFAAIREHYSTSTKWVAGGLNSGIWLSQDGGDSWTRLTNGLPRSSSSIGRIGLAIAASAPQTVYALFLDDPGDLIGVYKTTNGGVSWGKQNASGAKSAFGGAGYYCGQIRVDPANANIVYLLDVGGVRSTDGGLSYTTYTTGCYVDQHALVILPDRLYEANDGGFYRSTNSGSSWFHPASLPVTQFYDLGIDPVDPSKRFGGTQDLGSLRTPDGGSSNWYNILAGDGFQCEVDPIDRLRVYCEQQYGNIFRSSDGGNTFIAGFHGIPPNDRENWDAPLVHDPRTTQRLYTASQRVFRSTDGAANWTAISGDLTDGPPVTAVAAPVRTFDGAWHLTSVVGGTVTTLAVSALDANLLWAGTDDGHVWVTQNGGSVWVKVDVPGRSEWVTRVEADPFSAAVAYVTFSGYRNGSRLPRIFRTVNFGASWSDISGDLPDIPLNGVNADPDPAMRGRLFVGSDLGVYVTDNYGLSWSLLGSGMPAVVVMDLDLIESSRQLFAGTYGRSLYVYDLNQLGPGDADGDGRDNLADCRPDDPTVFASPGEVSGLVFAADRLTLSWNSALPSAGAATVHQVLRGLVAELPVGGASDSCIVAGTPASSVTDTDVPLADAAFWYLVRAGNACGTGTYGSTSGGSPRIGGACP
jgi:photosystem II stability/assembly factor-like uncharacterized protein